MASVNVELKARLADLEVTAARCVGLGAEEIGLLVQRDTYFAAPHGRLKLREHLNSSHPAELIAYRRADATEPEASTYVRTPVANPATLTESLDAALGVTVIVEKRRRLFLWSDVRIHLDDVTGLGTFLEFEALVAPDGSNLPAAHAKVGLLRTELGLTDEDLVASGYADLLTGGPEALLRAADRAMRGAYAPYSGFKVGAAIRAVSGTIYVGANVENASYPQGACAEASAVGALSAGGESQITAVAVVAEKSDRCPPCGGCRQRLSEFGGPDTPVYLGRPGLEPFTTTLGELLPLSFGKDDLT